VPADNPYVGGDPADDLTWAYGTRNPWRASFDPATGALWVPDVGAESYEEVNRFAPSTAGAAANLGWPLCEGIHSYPPADPPATCDVPGTVAPLIEYAHSDGNCSVIGGYVYRGDAEPSLVGRYFFGDYCTGNIWSVPADYASGDAVGQPLVTGLHLTSFGVDALGELYVTAVNGTLWHVLGPDVTSEPSG